MRWGHACAVALALWMSSAGAATVEGLTPRALVERSEVVFIGTVQSADSRYVPEEMAVVTDFSFAVEQVVKGPDKNLRHFVLTQLGGEVVEAGNRVTQAVPGYAQYRGPVRGLWMCGSSNHPGGGIMAAPGANAAREILKSMRKPNTVPEGWLDE